MNSVFFDHQEALEGVQAALAQVLNISDPAAISFQFLAQNAELVQRAMEGDTLAIGELQAKMAEDLILHLDVDDSKFLEVLGMSKQEYLDWIYALPEGEIGLSDLEALEKLANLMLQTGHTVEEIESAFAGCGLDLDITPITQELETVPVVADDAGKSAGQKIIDGLSTAFPVIASVAQKIGEVIADSTATDVQVNNEETTAESTSLYETADVIKQDVPYSVTVPTYEASVSDQGKPVFLTGSQTIKGLSYARFTAVPNPTTLKKEDKNNVSAVQITAGNKTVGGKISHVNSSGGNKRTSTPTSSSPRTSSPRSSSSGSSSAPHVSAPTIKVHDTKYNERKTIDDY